MRCGHSCGLKALSVGVLKVLVGMPSLIFFKLLALFLVVALGWLAGQRRWLGLSASADSGNSDSNSSNSDPSRVLANAAFFIFIPALLFRTTARIDMVALPWATLAAFFIPVLGVLVAVYVWRRVRQSGRDDNCRRTK